LDGNKALSSLQKKLEQSTIETIEDGVMTGDLASLSNNPDKQSVDTQTFLLEIQKRLDTKIS
jgi:isocitrate dehydrogenase